MTVKNKREILINLQKENMKIIVKMILKIGK